MDTRIYAYIDCSGLDGENITAAAVQAQNRGADGVLLYDFNDDETARERYLDIARSVSRAIDIPFLTTTRAHRFEDVKKAFYTGAKAVVLLEADTADNGILKESTDRFGVPGIFVLANGTGATADAKELLLIAEHEGCEIEELAAKAGNEDGAEAVSLALKLDDADIMELKRKLAAKGLQVNTFSGRIDFSELKKNADGLIPCVVQDYKTHEVLMVAYMNEESYRKTIETGVMTYYSRSRQQLWLKGETSGHFQYVRKLTADCDKDTLLAEVVQIGAACHTGSRSCFFNEIVRHEYENKNISAVLASLYEVVCDRKVHPKEGSYTNYLFNKGIDKILKKCGEEATEMVIAAKNPSHEELKYEIADLLYHMTVLMVECGLSWEEVAAELANR